MAIHRGSYWCLLHFKVIMQGNLPENIKEIASTWKTV